MPDVIGKRIKRLRTARRLSLRALASLAQVPVSSISGVEVGTRSGRRLSAETCARLAKALGVTVDALVSLDDEEDEALRPVVDAVA